MEIVHEHDLQREAERDEVALPCPACAGDTFEALLSPRELEAEGRWLRGFYRRRVTGAAEALEDRVAFTQAEPTRIVRCLACGVVLRSPRPSPAALRALYAGDTYGRSALQALARNQTAFYEGKAQALRNVLPENARVLEVGPFVGGFLAAAARLGWRATGVDVGKETVGFMRERGLDVLSGDLLEVHLPRGAWDAVFVWNTFDQLPEPGAMLERAHALLRPGGLLALRVPNGDFETACLRRRRAHRRRAARVRRAQAYNNFMAFPYLVGYTAAALRGLLARRGFDVERIVADTILPLSDDATRPFAVVEEARAKRAVMRAAALARRATGAECAPWLDVYARRAGGTATPTGGSGPR